MRFAPLVPFVLLMACAGSRRPSHTTLPPRSASTAPPTVPDDVPFTDADVHLRVPFPLEHACLSVGTTEIALPPCDESKAGAVAPGVAFFIEARTPHGRALLMMRFLEHVHSVRDDGAYVFGLRTSLSQFLGVRLDGVSAAPENLVLKDGSSVMRATFHAASPTGPDALAHVVTLTLIGRRGLYTLVRFSTAAGAQDADDAISGAITSIVHDDGEPSSDPLEQAVTRQSQAIRACYEAGLAEDPSLSGRIEVEGLLRADGTMARVDAVGNSGLPPHVEQCVLAQLRPMRAAPSTRSWSFSIPIALKPAPAVP